MKFSYALISMACLPSVIVHAAQDPNKSPKRATPLGVMEAQISELQKQLDDTFAARQKYQQDFLKDDKPETRDAKREYARLDKKCNRLETKIEKLLRDAKIRRNKSFNNTEPELSQTCDFMYADPYGKHSYADPYTYTEKGEPDHDEKGEPDHEEPPQTEMVEIMVHELGPVVGSNTKPTGNCFKAKLPRPVLSCLTACKSTANKMVACPAVLVAYLCSRCWMSCEKPCNADREDYEPCVDFNTTGLRAFFNSADETLTELEKKALEKFKNGFNGFVQGTFGTGGKKSRVVTAIPDLVQKFKVLCDRGICQTFTEELDFQEGDGWCCCCDDREVCTKLYKTLRCMFNSTFGLVWKALRYCLCCLDGTGIGELSDILDVAVGVTEIAAVAGGGM